MERIINLIRSVFICFISFILVFTGSFPVNAEDIAPVEEPEKISTEAELNTVNADWIYTDEYNIGMMAGDSRSLPYTLDPATADETPVFSLDYADNNCITVDSNGNVTANCYGSARVKATIANGNSVDYYIYVAEEYPTFMIPELSSYTIGVGMDRYISMQIEPWNAYYVKKTVVSDDPSVVSVDGDGYTFNDGFYIRGQSVGTANITVSCDNGMSIVIPVEVTNDVFADMISSDETSISMKIGEDKQLTYTLRPSDATEKPQFILNYANNNCITLDSNGWVHANSHGSASVYAKITNGSYLDYRITVAPDPETMSFEKESYTGIAGKYGYIYPNYNPWDARNCRKHVVSSDSDVVRPVNEWVTDSGIELEYVSSGTATVTVTADNGVSASAVFNVVSGDYADYIYRSEDMKGTIYMQTGNTIKLGYSLASSDGRTTFADEKVTFEVTYGDEYVSVDDNGIISCLKAGGTANVKASITNGEYVTYYITTYSLPQEVRFGQDTYTVNLWATGYAYASGYPVDASNCPLTYSIEDTSIAEINGSSIQPKSVGSTRIIATAENGVKGYADLIVRDGHYADYITNNGNPTDFYLEYGQSKKLDYVLSSNNGSTDFSDETVTIRPDNRASALATVSQEGTVTAGNRPGKGTVTAAISNGRSITYTVYIGEKITDVKFDETKNYQLSSSSGSFPINDYMIVDTDAPTSSVLSYTSDNPVISVDSRGNAMISGTGTAVVRAYYKNDPSVYAEHVFEVQDSVSPHSMSPLPSSAMTMYKDYTYKLEARYDPGYSISSTNWSSSDPEIASVNAYNEICYVRALKPGHVSITAVSKSNQSVSAVFEIDVIEGTDEAADSVETLEISEKDSYSTNSYNTLANPETYYFRKGKMYYYSHYSAINECVGPSLYAGFREFIRSGKFSVTQGGAAGSGDGFSEGWHIIPLETGETEYQVNGKTFRFVVVDTDDVIVNVEKNVLHPGDSAMAAFCAESGSRNAEWSSSDENVATVDQYGYITAVNYGTAVITATVDGKSGSIEIKVEKDPLIPESIEKISELPDELYVGYRYINLGVKYNEGASGKTIWTSSDPDIIELRDTGIANTCGINIKKAGGPVTITAASALNPSLSTTFEFTAIDGHPSPDVYDVTYTLGYSFDGIIGGIPESQKTVNPNLYTMRLGSNYQIQYNLSSNVCIPGENYDPAAVFAEFFTVRAGAGSGGIDEEKIIAGGGFSGDASKTGEYTVVFYGRTLTIRVVDTDDIILNTSKKVINPGETVQVTAEPKQPETPVEFSSSDEYVATVDENGIVTGIGGGTAVITAKAGETQGSIEITVTGDPAVRPLEAELIADDEIYATEPTVLKATATGGSAPYKYQFTAKIDGKWTTLQNGTESECTYTFEKAGSYPVNVTVTDSTGARVKSQKTLTVTVRPSEDPLDAELILAEDVYAGEATVLKAEATGGSAPYKYQFTAKIDGKWIPLQNGTESECTYTFEKAGSYPVNVTVTDSAGTRIKSQKTLTVTVRPSEDPLDAELILAEDVYAGEATVLKAVATGGSAPYKYQFTAKIDGKWIPVHNGTESECTYTFEKAGSYPVNVTVTDSAGTRIKSQKTLTVTVRPSEDPLVAELIVPGEAYVGEETALSATATGGSAPYKYQFTAKIDGKWTTLYNGTWSEYLYIFKKEGSYPVNVTVTDSAGTRVKSQKTIRVVLPDSAIK